MRPSVPPDEYLEQDEERWQGRWAPLPAGARPGCGRGKNPQATKAGHYSAAASSAAVAAATLPAVPVT